ncbi:NAD(P)-binding protein [Hypomontagnella monticulosa]|nr:NAD(P)-binding protein [Hypomontagnella monticulosa]
MANERSELTSRELPRMAEGKSSVFNDPPPSLLRERPADRALERFRVKGNAIVTGGAGDLAIVACRALLEHGLEGLMIFDVNPAEAQTRIEALEKEFPTAKIFFTKVDVTDEDAVNAAVEKTIGLFGSHVNILLSFAGMVACGHALDWSKKDWNRVLDVNTVGGYLVGRAIARVLIERRFTGSMIFIASISGHRVNSPQPQVSYNVSKAGVLAMVKSLAAEWGPYGIRVNSLSPGYMDTILNEGDGLDEARKMWNGRNPMGRMGQPDELSGAIVMLASRAGSYINGADLLIDGGQTLLM